MRAQGRPGARCTRGLVCNCAQGTRTRAYRYRRSIPAFPAQWLYGLLRALPGERLFCHRRPREASLLSDLMPAPRHQDHTTSPYARATHVSRSSRVHRIPPRVRDDRDPPLSSGETDGDMRLICPYVKRNIFARRAGQVLGDLPVVLICRAAAQDLRLRARQISTQTVGWAKAR